MGCISEAICKDCGTRYSIQTGDGFANRDLHCDKCGKGKTVYFMELREAPSKYRSFEEYAGKCECGGNYTLDAPPRCPNCRSTNFEHDPTKFTLYD